KGPQGSGVGSPYFVLPARTQLRSASTSAASAPALKGHERKTSDGRFRRRDDVRGDARAGADRVAVEADPLDRAVPARRTRRRRDAPPVRETRRARGSARNRRE